MSRIDPRDPAIAAALEKLFNDKDPTNWVLLGYVPKSNNVLEVKGQGTEGWEEMCDELSEGKISYGLCQFKVNEVNRYVYLSWLGEGVQGLQKGQYNNHAIDMQRVFRGYHVQINARGDADIEIADVLRQVKTGLGADYDAGQKDQGDKRGTPVCAPIKVDTGAIDMEASASYWSANKGEETSSGYKKVEDFKAVGGRDEFWRQQQADASAPAAPARREPEVKAQTGSLKSKFESLAVAEAAPPPQRAAVPPPKRIATPAAAPAAAAPAPKPAAAPAPKPAAAPAPAPAPAAKAAPPPTPAKAVPPPPPSSNKPKPKAPEPEPEPVYEEEYYEEEGAEEYYEEGAEEYYEEGAEEYYEEAAAPEAAYEEPAAAEAAEYYEEEAGEYYEEEGAAEDFYTGETATGLYAYNSSTEGDLVFGVGDIINIIDRSEDWWKGELNGQVGYFPSNFVRLN
eukprot:TRINITY_DN1101_c0_g1_i2.p2 TRINITY_DN1101_c0_g1~~TRINITY_DN1101_c0_g1_i2.p2  ORF type:complete len:471 (+),score=240.83 TRINITY_DN1101_c0_g1_i2:55-1413(+)